MPLFGVTTFQPLCQWRDLMLHFVCARCVTSTDQPVCLPCPAGPDCGQPGLDFDSLVTQPGWWRPSNTSLNYYRCRVDIYVRAVVAVFFLFRNLCSGFGLGVCFRLRPQDFQRCSLLVAFAYSRPAFLCPQKLRGSQSQSSSQRSKAQVLSMPFCGFWLICDLSKPISFKAHWSAQSELTMSDLVQLFIKRHSNSFSLSFLP